MKRILICITLLLTSLFFFAQGEQEALVIYIPYADTISQEMIDSIERQTGDYILSYHPKMRHLIPSMRCRRKPTPGRRIGVFSVAKDRQVSFAQGNLQYVQSEMQWQFANQQYEYIGANNVNNGKLADNIDLFGWSSDNVKVSFGVSTSTNVADYKGNFVDWGENEIQGDEPNTWRTLSQEEWNYIFEKRKNAKQLYSKGSIDGVRGMIVLPDNWVLPEGLHFTAAPNNLTMDLDINVYTKVQWEKMEEAGAVFLCPTGRRDGLQIGYLVEYGGYWSSSRSGNHVKHLYFNYKSLIFNTNYNSGDYSFGFNGRAVRLVHDTIVPPPAPCETFEVNGVTFNMMCVEGGTFTMGSDAADAPANEMPAHQVTLSDYMIGETEITQELWTAVMGTTLDDELFRNNGDAGLGSGDNYPMYCITWFQAQEFVTRLSELTGFDFRLPTEAEWEYAARGGKLSKGFLYAGSDTLDHVAWWNDPKGLVHPVAKKKPNELGIYDMCGNICEWTLDGYSAYTPTAQINPYVPCIKNVVQRGMSSHSAWGENDHRITYRYNKDPYHARTRVGLRLALSNEVKIKTITLNNTLAFNMRMVEGGTFMMGGTDGDSNAGENEFPIHSVTLSDYYIAQISVTQELWTAVMGTTIDDELARNNGETGLGKGDDFPMYCVTWFQAREFAERLSRLTGCSFRLPTEAEWEYAARGGKYSKGYKYAGSDNIDEVAWYKVTGGKVKPNALLKANELGLYDMSGNVWDWVLDGYSEYTDKAQINPYVPRETDVVERGGSSHIGWSVHYNRVSFRTGLDPKKARTRVGMRLVMDVHEYVDLGLSVKWAPCNVGAETPEEYGDYFAWGEVEPKEVYSWENYKWCDGTISVSNITKYNKTDGLTTLELEDDAAHVNWGGEWRMPTVEEQTELREQCVWTWTSVNGIKGYRVTGVNGNSIFLPAAGNITEDKLSAFDAMGYQWSSSVKPSINAHRMHFSKSTIEDYEGGSRACGASVRPVYDGDGSL